MNTFREYVIIPFLQSSLIDFASVHTDLVSYFSTSSSTSSLLIGKFCTFRTMSFIVDRFIPSSWDFNALLVLKDFIINNLFQDNYARSHLFTFNLYQNLAKLHVWPDWVQHLLPVNSNFIDEMGAVWYPPSSSYHATLPFDFPSRK